MIKEYKKITIKNLSKTFGNVTVLGDFSLSVNRGEFVTLLGPSGCGKTTALNCITGLVPITSGEICVDDECIDNGKNVFVPPEKRGFGMVFQNYALFPHLTVRRNVRFGLELMKLNKEEMERKVTQALRLVRLEQEGSKFPMQLSGGQQQRVAIARAVVMEPRLLLLDEPLSNLDAKLRLEMRHELKSLHDSLHITSIYVTHDQHEALALSDRIVVMRDGIILQVGTPEEIYTDPVNLFVADFMGCQNKWPGKIVGLRDSGTGMEVVLDTDLGRLDAKVTASSDAGRLTRLKEAHGRKHDVIAVVRADEMVLREEERAAEQANVVACRVNSVEYLGQMFHISGHAGKETPIEARLPVRTGMGGAINLYIPPEKILVFTKDME